MNIRQVLDEYKCVPGDRYAYLSSKNQITYDPGTIETVHGTLSLLHEIAHLRLGHFSYTYDIELLSMEIEAWEETKRLAKLYNVVLDQKYVNRCLKSYDKWLTKRATCPRCNSFSLQRRETKFKCVYCDSEWRVSRNKQKRIMRKLIN